jgi:hypothetical protein
MPLRYFLTISPFCALALLLGCPPGWATDACPSLSGCSYQAGKGLPGQAAATRQPPIPEVMSPVILKGCDNGGCADPDGARYNAPAGAPASGVYLDPQGRRCVRSGEFLQCG